MRGQVVPGVLGRASRAILIKGSGIQGVKGSSEMLETLINLLK